MTNWPGPDDRQPIWFLVLFALAASGGAIAYVPLLTVLLPLKITALTGGEDVAALAKVAFFGAVMASLANIAFGMLSDRSGRRVPWIVSGLVMSSVLLVVIGHARDLGELVLLIMAWQVALNMMLGPLLAWAGDCFPDSQKGLLGGALSLAPALGALSGSLVTLESVVAVEARLLVVAGLVAALVLPVVVLGSGRERPALMQPPVPAQGDFAIIPSRSRVQLMWGARFLVQVAEAGLFAFLLFWLRSLSSGFHENTAANIFSAVLVISVPATLWLGRWSDRHARPILPLAVAAAIVGLGLVGMAFAGRIDWAIGAYVVFGIAASTFLSLHTAQTLRVLPQPRHRGRDLGVFNLTNTMPSLVMPWLTLLLVPDLGFTALFLVFAALAGVAAMMLAGMAVREPAQ